LVDVEQLASDSPLISHWRFPESAYAVLLITR
jgi:hypothetical protein